MKKSMLAVLIAVILIGGVAVFALGGKDDKGSDNTPQATNTSDGQAAFGNAGSGETQEVNTVTIQNFAFAPKNIKVKVGTKVTWTNQDDAHHDITPDSPSDNFKASELLAKGESYSYTFEKAGTYAYHCSPHPYMKATVEVVE